MDITPSFPVPCFRNLRKCPTSISHLFLSLQTLLLSLKKQTKHRSRWTTSSELTLVLWPLQQPLLPVLPGSHTHRERSSWALPHQTLPLLVQCRADAVPVTKPMFHSSVAASGFSSTHLTIPLYLLLCPSLKC